MMFTTPISPMCLFLFFFCSFLFRLPFTSNIHKLSIYLNKLSKLLMSVKHLPHSYYNDNTVLKQYTDIKTPKED